MEKDKKKIFIVYADREQYVTFVSTGSALHAEKTKNEKKIERQLIV